MAELSELVLLLDGIVKRHDHFSPTVHKFSRNPPNSRCQQGYMKVSYREPELLQWSVSLTVIHCFLFGACKLINIFVCGGGGDSNYAEN
jgi:hypothetical protein